MKTKKFYYRNRNSYTLYNVVADMQNKPQRMISPETKDR